MASNETLLWLKTNPEKWKKLIIFLQDNEIFYAVADAKIQNDPKAGTVKLPKLPKGGKVND